MVSNLKQLQLTRLGFMGGGGHKLLAIASEFPVGRIGVSDFHGIRIGLLDAFQGVNEKFFLLAGHYRKLIIPVNIF